MRKNRFILSVLVITTILSMTGCSSSASNVNLIQRPSLLDDTKEDIQKVLDQLLPTDTEYVTAKRSEPKQSIIIDDVNNDGVKEAIVLYQEVKDNRQIHLLVLQQKDNKWSKVSDLLTQYTYLDYFSVIDLNKDGEKELVAGLGYSEDDTNKQLFIFNLKKDKLVLGTDSVNEKNTTDTKGEENVTDTKGEENVTDTKSKENTTDTKDGGNVTDTKSKENTTDTKDERNKIDDTSLSGNSDIMNTKEITYQWMDISDYTGDEIPDILILSGEVGQNQTATLLSYKDNQISTLSTLELMPDAYHENVIAGKLADGRQALFVDSGVGAHSMITEIITYKKDKLILVGDEMDGVLLKAYPLYSNDLNDDGIIEVGGMYIPSGYEDAALAEIPFIYSYHDYRIDGTNDTVEERYVDNAEHFYITLPKEWYEKVTVKKLDNGVRLLDNKEGKTLFEVYWSKKSDLDKSNTVLKETKNMVYYIKDDNNLIIPKENFHLLEEEFD